MLRKKVFRRSRGNSAVARIIPKGPLPEDILTIGRRQLSSSEFDLFTQLSGEVSMLKMAPRTRSNIRINLNAEINYLAECLRLGIIEASQNGMGKIIELTPKRREGVKTRIALLKQKLRG